MNLSFDFQDRSILVCVAGRTDIGQRRSENQDSFVVIDFSNPEPDGVLLEPDIMAGAAVAGEFALGSKGALCLVADGMGGAAAGGVASSMAVAAIEYELRRTWSAGGNSSPAYFAQCLKDAVEASNRRIHDAGQANAGFRGMGTTATAVGLLDGFLYIAQVGDSRAYLLRNGTASQLTRDQSFIQHMIESGTMTEEEAERSNHRNIILQALGTAPHVEVDLTYQEMRRNDLLLVCSDGLFKAVSREELVDCSRHVTDPAVICDQLVALANQRGGVDNITVVAARFDGIGLNQPLAGDSVMRRVYSLAGN